MQNPLPPLPDDLDAEPGQGLDRLISLSDGIYAFAMTLLAVNIGLPALTEKATDAQLTEAVLALLPQFIVFVSSFLLVGLYWQVSRRIFRIIAREDSTVTWLTLIQLLFVAFLPVASGLFDTHASVPIIVVLYAGTLLGIGIVGQVLLVHVDRAKLADPTVSPHLLRYYVFRGFVTIFIYSLLLIAGVLAPPYARLVLLLLFVYPFLQNLYRIAHRMFHSASPTQQ